MISMASNDAHLWTNLWTGNRPLRGIHYAVKAFGAGMSFSVIGHGIGNVDDALP
jgi:hypothetical protein